MNTNLNALCFSADRRDSLSMWPTFETEYPVKETEVLVEDMRLATLAFGFTVSGSTYFEPNVQLSSPLFQGRIWVLCCMACLQADSKGPEKKRVYYYVLVRAYNVCECSWSAMFICITNLIWCLVVSHSLYFVGCASPASLNIPFGFIFLS